MINHIFDTEEGEYKVIFSRSHRTIHVWVVPPDGEVISDMFHYESQRTAEEMMSELRDFENKLVKSILEKAREYYKEEVNDKQV